MGVVIIWIILAFLCGKYAEHKGKKFGNYFLLSFLITPLIGFIALLVTNENKDEVEKRAIETGKEVNKNDFIKDFMKLTLWTILFLIVGAVLLIIYFIKNFGDSIMI